MSESEDVRSPHEIVIVRRKGGGHGDGHHGGAWKIAFADFMTALMCFFLVMWLVNASDKKTITQIATYFNPLRLNDRLTSQKGLDDGENRSPPSEPSKDRSRPKSPPKDAKAKSRTKEEAAGRKAEAQSAVERAIAAEVDLIRDPYGMLHQIAASEPMPDRPMSSAQQPADGKARMPKDVLDPQGASPADTPEPGARKQPPVRQAASATGPGELATDRLRAEIVQAIAALPPGLKPAVEITDLGREILISITDDIDHGMYAIGSSRPTPILIQVMDRVAKALAAKGGAVVVRGHTDARPYSTAGYDNWRLSAARAQMAFHMLVRGGLPGDRVQRIEGHADRSPRDRADPLAPQNRRIEILVAKDRS